MCRLGARTRSLFSLSLVREGINTSRASWPRGSTFFAVSKIAKSEPALVNSKRRVTEATTRARTRASSLFLSFLTLSYSRVSALAIFLRLTSFSISAAYARVHRLTYFGVNTGGEEHVTERMTKELLCDRIIFHCIFRECRGIDGTCRLLSTRVT